MGDRSKFRRQTQQEKEQVNDPTRFPFKELPDDLIRHLLQFMSMTDIKNAFRANINFAKNYKDQFDPWIQLDDEPGVKVELELDEIKMNIVTATVDASLEVGVPSLQNTTLFQTAISYDKTVHSVSLCGTQIPHEVAVQIANALRINNVLTDLSLWDNNIGDEGITAISQALKDNKKTNLATLNVAYNNISFDGTAALASTLIDSVVLTTLNLSNNRIDEEGGNLIANALKGNKVLTSLDIGNNFLRRGAIDIANALEENNTLTELSLSRNYIDRDGGKELGKALITNKTLTDLNLSKNEIRDSGMTSLADALIENDTLKSLSLSFNTINLTDAESFASALLKNNTLTSLEFSKCFMRVDAAHRIIDALVDKETSTLQYLNISGNEFNSIVAEDIKEVVERIKGFTLKI